MKQLVFIHGGETFDTYDAYLEALRNEFTYDPIKEKEKGRRWKHTLAESLGEDWEVHTPAMPSKYNAKYLEWSIWFEKVLPYLHDGVVLVGHSLGGIFLAKYLSEHQLPIRPRAVCLVAAPFDTRDTDFSLADFTLEHDLSGLARQTDALFLYQSEDDDVVPFSALESYQKLLPAATVRIFTDRGHFMGPEFPEIVEDIRSLS